jgi:hypothetical protein
VDSNVYTFADKSASALTKAISSMSDTVNDKCTYIIKTTCDAPGFSIPSSLSSLTTDLQIGYVEYDPIYTTVDSSGTSADHVNIAMTVPGLATYNSPN